MTAAKSVCLNMIVKNEMGNIERCLAAVADHIDCWVIGDTGSTDGTQAFIRDFFASRGIPGELHEFPFVNFEQARNEALRLAYESALAFDYLLLDDADMELIVEDKHYRAALTGPGYQLLQRSTGGYKYWNTRIVQRDAGAWYHGVTHEYIQVSGGTERLSSVWYLDHASGSNRKDKFDRDAKLLLDALEKDPDNRRYWFYLAQSYRDGGRKREAVDAYAKRIEMGGWAEEAWESRLQMARCLRDLGDEAGFVAAALAAYNEKPRRAEALYDLARHYRIKGHYQTSCLFSEPGLDMVSPTGDVLFVEDWIYQHGVREEFSIAANYSADPVRKQHGAVVCDALSLDRGIPDHCRGLARWNLHFYSEGLQSLASSFQAKPIESPIEPGYQRSNPSVTLAEAQIVAIVRGVNYRLTEGGEYQTADNGVYDTVNSLVFFDDDLNVVRSGKILLPENLPPPAYDQVRGFEDARLFRWRGEFWCVSTVRELASDGRCQQVLARIDQVAPDVYRMAEFRVLTGDGPLAHEKNWMPIADGDRLSFIRRCDPLQIVDELARPLSADPPPISADLFRGSTQAVAFDGGWLVVIHEVRGEGAERSYRHRFVWLDKDLKLRRVSRRFYFQDPTLEFAAGLAWHPDQRRLLLSYGVRDAAAWMATVDAEDVRALLTDVALLGRFPPPSAGETDAVVRLAGMLQLAREMEAQGRPADDVIATYDRAISAFPDRAEAYHGAARRRRSKGDYAGAYDRAKRGRETLRSAAISPAEQWIYDYGLMAELAESAFWLGKYDECIAACDQLAAQARAPAAELERIRAVRAQADARLADISKLTLGPYRGGAARASSRQVPKLFHFITGLDPDFGGKAFSFIHYMAIQSALAVNEGFEARVYFHYQPSGKYWDKIKDRIQAVPVEIPTEIFGNPLAHFAHKADVLRLRILLEHGGIYLDLDTICQRPFAPLLGDRVVMGQEEQRKDDGSRDVAGLCNATIIAPPRSRFLQLWYDAYRDFEGGHSGDLWNKFSVQVPMRLAEAHPDLVRIEPAASFFWPSWDNRGLKSMFSEDNAFPEAYSFHLWESASWGLVKDLDPTRVRTVDTSYNRIARRFLSGQPAMADNLASE